MIFVLYKLYQNDVISENFQATSSTSVEDWNAVNQLAQISRQLMTGTLTVPGGLTVSGPLVVSGNLKLNNTVNFNPDGTGGVSIQHTDNTTKSTLSYYYYHLSPSNKLPL